MVAYSFKRQFVTPIRVGLGMPIAAGLPMPEGENYTPKCQTIRALGRRRHARPGETVQLYTGMRTKHCRKIGDAKCVRVDPIHIYLGSNRIAIAIGSPDAQVFDRTAQLDAFAQRDGFADWADMREFWREEHGDLKRLGPFVGILILWSPLL